ncbi:MAG: CheR family methyltransferase [Myxococcota bacterium]
MSAPYVVGLGASAGGLEALERFLGALPADTGASFVVVVDHPPDGAGPLPERVAAQTDMPVAVVTQNTHLEPDIVYVVSSGQRLRLSGRELVVERLRWDGRPFELPIDRFFRQLAAEVRDRAIAVVLSGSGSDGARGVAAIKGEGGAVLVQDPATATLDGMPRSASSLAPVDHMGSPADLAEHIAILCRADPAETALAVLGDSELQQILSDIRRRSGTDLRSFRPPMVRRRVLRRMAICGIDSVAVYRSRLESDAHELEGLRQDLLIGVTRFFRDPTTFEALQAFVVDWLAERNRAAPLRVWCAACSAGHEAYSLVMVMLEALDQARLELPLKVFATDVNDAALARASRGTYSFSEVADIPARLRAKYFRSQGADFVVSADLRERVLFANHDVVFDAPFTRMDFVSCRNLLIYLDDDGQQRVLRSLHSALRPHTGLLLLGKAETASAVAHGVSRVKGVAELYRKTAEADLPRARDVEARLSATQEGARDELRTLDEVTAHRIRALEAEVQRQRGSLRTARQEIQTAREEQQSTSEELVASHEELQATNEELHSVTEELHTITRAYQRQHEDLTAMATDLENLLKSTETATLFLDRQLRVRRFSRGVERVVRLADSDVGRSIRQLAPRMVVDFVDDAATVVTKGTTRQREVRDVDGAWLRVRLAPYRSLAGDETGVIVTFVEVTRIKHAEGTARVMSQSLRDVNRSLTHQAEQLEDMVSVVASDLRQPLAALRDHLDLRDAASLAEARRAVRQLERRLEDLSEVAGRGRRSSVAAPPKRTELAGTRALVVGNDECMVRRSLHDLDLDLAQTVQLARRYLERHRYHLVIVDASLPDGHGLELLATIRDTSPHAAVIVMSGPEGTVQLDVWDPSQVVAVLDKDLVRPSVLRSLVELHVEPRSRVARTQSRPDQVGS